MSKSYYIMPQDDIKGTWLTREEIDKISSRISRRVSENIRKQLEEALAASAKQKKEGDAAN